jgi:hypothetical protein
VKGWSVSNSPITTPLIDIGTRSQMIVGWRSCMNRSTEISTMVRAETGRAEASALLASCWLSYSPPHSIE